MDSYQRVAIVFIETGQLCRAFGRSGDEGEEFVCSLSLTQEGAAVDMVEILAQPLPVLRENFCLLDSFSTELVVRLSAKGSLSVSDKDEFTHSVRSTTRARRSAGGDIPRCRT